MLGSRQQQRATPSLRSRAAELAEQIAEDSFDDNHVDFESEPFRSQGYLSTTNTID